MTTFPYQYAPMTSTHTALPGIDSPLTTTTTTPTTSTTNTNTDISSNVSSLIDLMKNFDPTNRSNIDYLAFRKVENTYKKTLWNMCNTKMKFGDFKDYINDNTTNYKFILYDNTSQSENENERLKVVKATYMII